MFHLKDPGVLIFIQKMLIRDTCLITIVYPILTKMYTKGVSLVLINA